MTNGQRRMQPYASRCSHTASHSFVVTTVTPGNGPHVTTTQPPAKPNVAPEVYHTTKPPIRDDNPGFARAIAWGKLHEALHLTPTIYVALLSRHSR